MIKAFIRERALEGNNASANCQLICWVNKFQVCRWWEGSSYNKFGQKAVNLGDLEIVWRVDSFQTIPHYSNFVGHKPETYLIGGLFVTQLAIDSVMTFRNWLFIWLCFQFCAVAKTGNRKLICAIGAALIAVWSVNGWFPDSIKAALEKLIFKTNSCFCTVSDKKTQQQYLPQLQILKEGHQGNQGRMFPQIIHTKNCDFEFVFPTNLWRSNLGHLASFHFFSCKLLLAFMKVTSTSTVFSFKHFVGYTNIHMVIWSNKTQGNAWELWGWRCLFSLFHCSYSERYWW